MSHYLGKIFGIPPAKDQRHPRRAATIQITIMMTMAQKTTLKH